jgi:hypothetical protein
MMTLDPPRQCSQCDEPLRFDQVRCPKCGHYEQLPAFDYGFFAIVVFAASALVYAWAKVTGRDGLANLLEWFV